MAFHIAPLSGPEDVADFVVLLDAYVASLGVDLAYQGWPEERASLPGPYAPPLGAALLARAAGGAPLGCVAIRPLKPGIAEMKRLFCAPAARGQGLGRALALAALDAARACGYRELWLDTLPEMQAAQSLYRALGFAPRTAYGKAVLPGTLFFSRAV